MQVNTHGEGALAPQARGKVRMMVARAFLAQNVAVGSAFGGFGVSVLPLQHKYGANAGTTSLALALCVLVLGLISPAIGTLMGRIGLRWTMLGGVLISALGYGLLAFAPSMNVVLALYALPIGIGFAMLGPFPASVLASNWHVHNPGLALGIANTPLLVALLPIIGLVVIRDHSLTTFYLLLAGLHMVLLPFLLGVSDGPADAAHRPDNHGHVAHAMVPARLILSSPRFWMLCLGAGFLSGVGIAGISLLGPFTVERGIAPAQGAALLSIMGAAAVAGSLAVGSLCTRFGAARALALVAAILGGSWAALPNTTMFPLMAITVLLIGACGAGVYPVVNILFSKMFGQDSLPRALGIFGVAILPITFGLPPLAGIIRDVAGSYVPVVAVFVAGCFAIAVVFGLVGRADQAPIVVA